MTSARSDEVEHRGGQPRGGTRTATQRLAREALVDINVTGTGRRHGTVCRRLFRSGAVRAHVWQAEKEATWRELLLWGDGNGCICSRVPWVPSLVECHGPVI